MSDRELLWLRRHRDLSRRLAGEHDRSKLLPQVLDAAIELTDAERGFLVLVSRNETTGRVKLKVEVARGFDKSRLLSGGAKVSRTVVTRVLEEDRPLVTTSEQDKDIIDVTSVKDRRVRSIVAVPLKLRGEIRGVVYLDHRFDPRAFTESDLPVLAAFADHAALTLETAELESDTHQAAEKLGAARRALDLLKAGAPVRAGMSDLVPAGEVPRFGGLVGGSEPMLALYDLIERAARCDAPILITGESGSGKELVAREVHARSERASEPFLCYSCAAVADPLLESELFGHRQGAFTGAERDRAGLFLEAGRGTLVLDEVGDMSPALQRKLLRVLQEGELRPLGAPTTEPVRCRVIATTQHDLPRRVEEGTFREDLYYRLDVLRLAVPPLRERGADLPALLSHFLAAEGKGAQQIAPEALELLCGFAWPGNVRELRNEVVRIASLSSDAVSASQLSTEIRQGRKAAVVQDAYAGKTLGEVEREMLVQALEQAEGNKSQAARLLGIPRSSLYDLIRRHALEG